MTFLQAVNEIFRRNGIIRGDTDTISTFSDTTHNASTQIAILAVQDELADLVSDTLIPYEKTSSTITLATSTRTYSLAADFIRFYGVPSFYRAAENRRVYEYPGGEEALRMNIYDFQTVTGDFNFWYWDSTTTKKVGVYQVPTTAENGEVWTYDYEKSVAVSTVSDVLPFHTDDESRAFVSMAGRRFKYMFEDTKNASDVVAVLMNDMTYRTAKSRLVNLIRPTNPHKLYRPVYR